MFLCILKKKKCHYLFIIITNCAYCQFDILWLHALHFFIWLGADGTVKLSSVMDVVDNG
jgi:hypothetical protein